VPISSRLLGADEEVLVDVRPHWVFLLGPAILTAIALAIAIAVGMEFSSASVVLLYVLAAMVAIPAAWLLARVVSWYGVSLVLTTRRLIYRRGILRRDFVQLRLQRVTEVQCLRSLWDRLVGCGRLVVEVDGDAPLVIEDVRHPRALQRIVNDTIMALEAADNLAPEDEEWVDETEVQRSPDAWQSVRISDATPPRGLRASSVHQSLIELDELWRRGIVSDMEFEAKKAELLAEM
jgi:hypothetical protein